MNSETKQCQNCKNSFVIEPEDFKFYEKISVPPPTWCPECRSQRRMIWRNERSLFSRTCDSSGKKIISCFSSNSGVKVFDRDIWWSDVWNPMNFGRDYDFSKTFFSQFKNLVGEVPMPAVFNGETTNSLYANHVGWMKDCYLSFGCWEDENCAYSNKLSFSKDCLDILSSSHLERSYEVMQSVKLYACKFTKNSRDCIDCMFIENCSGCSNCFGCINLRNKNYHIFNKPYTKEDYQKKIKEFDSGSYQSIQGILREFNALKEKSICKFANITNTKNVTGDNLSNVADSEFCFDLVDDVRNCKYVTNGGFKMYDTYDGYGIGITELCYESLDTGLESSRQLFGIVTWHGHTTNYTYNCHSCSNLFACIGLRNKSYCILNKQYTKEEYESLVPKIIKHMNDMPYIDKKGRVYKYGEFFPPELSPFSYNETIAQEYFPLTKEQALEQGYSWKDPEPRNYQITLKTEDIPDHIKDIKDSILNDIIQCAHNIGTSDVQKCNEQCTEAFRIIPQELDFLRKQNLPIPRLCPNCRHYQRIKQRNPLKLWHRKCMCGTQTTYQNTIEHEHKDSLCPNEFETTYAPERPEIVYCESCYLKEVV